MRTLAIVVIAVVVVTVLAVRPHPMERQPFPDAHEVADTARQLVRGNGYVTYVHDGKAHRPRYAPGFPLALVPFAALGNVQLGATFYGALYVVIAAVAAWSLKGPAAGAIAAILIGLSPFARMQASMIMSDALAAALTVLLVPLLRTNRIGLAGFAAGAAVAIRLPMVVNLVALLIVVPMRRRAMLFAAPPLAALGLFNWVTYGGPLRSGYDYWYPNERFFGLANALKAPMFGDGPWLVTDRLRGLLMRWVCPCPDTGPQAAMSNLAYYPSILLGAFWLFVPPLLPLLGIAWMWRHRDEPAARYTFCVIVFTLAIFTFYFYQGARYMAGPATLLAVFASTALVELVDSLRTARRRT
jgi:hypothetical protein